MKYLLKKRMLESYKWRCLMYFDKTWSHTFSEAKVSDKRSIFNEQSSDHAEWPFHIARGYVAAFERLDLYARTNSSLSLYIFAIFVLCKLCVMYAVIDLTCASNKGHFLLRFPISKSPLLRLCSEDADLSAETVWHFVRKIVPQIRHFK